MTRIPHTVQTHRHPPDGRQFVMCICPLGVDHPPADLMVEAEDAPGMWWVRFTVDRG